MNDPFAAAAAQQQAAQAPPPEEAQQQTEPSSPWDNPPPETNKPAPAPRPVVAGSDGKVVLTFKGGTGFDAPWIVVHATDLDDALNYVDRDSEKFIDLMGKVQSAGGYFAGLGGGSAAPKQQSSGGNSGGRQAPPAAAQQAPNGEKRYCSHGEMGFISGVSKKNGKPYQMFVCSERDRSKQCDAQFLN